MSEPQKLSLTPRRAAHLVLQRPENWQPDDEQLVQRMAQHPELAEAIELALQFAQFVRQRQPSQLDSWLEQALKSQLSPFHRFAKRLREDYDAVRAGLTLPWSNGQIEGQINRLKMLKRQMYGRAGMELLSRRFLLAVSSSPSHSKWNLLGPTNGNRLILSPVKSDRSSVTFFCIIKIASEP